MVAAMTDQNALKRAVAAKALEYVQDGMKLGLGSGSTAVAFSVTLVPQPLGSSSTVPRARSPSTNAWDLCARACARATTTAAPKG